MREEQSNAEYVREVHDKGLRFDRKALTRRGLLAAVGGAGALAFIGRAVVGGDASAATEDATCLEEVASETAGPYPGDGSNGPDVRIEDGIVRRDIRSSYGDSSTVAEGVPLEFSLVVQDLECNPLVGAAVYAWHCDREGLYSLYSDGVTDENYLRGIQVTDDTGTVTFTSIFPACYLGRWPHIHFEVYASLDDATSGAGPIRKTSQIALPEDVSDTVYAEADGYELSVSNMEQITLETDNVFGEDSAEHQMATVTGDVTSGYVATLTITVDPENEEETGGGAPGGPPPSSSPSVSASASASAE
ncbi:intradiol ring-cleavage dioxygenase [Actinoplanes sp. NBRC 101535]|uniref:dioxygenase family protein n=1 Tax=Actinoplanes sp. NBRC 101535 TaxID=3032196 RepID=UPI0024A40605|nr:intradiol ring-cleavage dioxygenase [Actinoplanes sp. NBRC 101535]GLY07939.1 3,4-dioxygenase subunit beta [Actinoplanes sp. NBRC 101535]